MKKVFKLGCLGFVGLLLLVIVVSVISSNNDKPATTTENTESGTSTEAVSSPAKEEVEEKPQLAKIGEELQVGDVVFKVNKIKTTKEIKNGEYFSFSPDSEGSVYLVVNVTVSNKGKETISTDSSFFKLLKDDIEYSPTTLLGAEGFFLYDGINPGLAQTGNVAFEIPETLKDYTLNVQTGFWGTEQGQITLK
ncbi:DUF4352 domain-containing protein [Paenibacillus herberti]|uniref:DUF4352 domain-containing protein n=1 Tax=Paenibacillus herberti TaxID=1619309 RepID=A0A229NZY7_9BACL|nr:DUF4352 domain-containing protein [Paenibacillus herberti]OXM15573.1 hypothetical protein CGZ75_02210 [Paenibacillus herberti]